MRIIIASLGILLCSTAKAQQGMQVVHDVYSSTATRIQTASVSGSSAVIVAAQTSSGTLGGYQSIEISALNQSSAIVCGYDPMVSTKPSSGWYGVRLTTFTPTLGNPGFASYLFRTTSAVPIWCLSENTTANTKCQVTQYK